MLAVWFEFLSITDVWVLFSIFIRMKLLEEYIKSCVSVSPEEMSGILEVFDYREFKKDRHLIRRGQRMEKEIDR